MIASARGRSFFVLLVALGVTAAGTRAEAAQVDQDDLQSRAGVRLDLNLPNRWEVDLEYQFRMVDDLSTYRGSYFTVETDYNFTKEIKAIAAYRRILTNEGNANSTWEAPRRAPRRTVSSPAARTTAGRRRPPSTSPALSPS